MHFPSPLCLVFCLVAVYFTNDWCGASKIKKTKKPFKLSIYVRNCAKVVTCMPSLQKQNQSPNTQILVKEKDQTTISFSCFFFKSSKINTSLIKIYLLHANGYYGTRQKNQNTIYWRGA